jgi:hypothetical protein
MNWEEFFEQYKDSLIHNHSDMLDFTVEELYQAIKRRLCAEIKVMLPNTGFIGWLWVEEE